MSWDDVQRARSFSDVRTRLLESAARLLGEEGPAALTTRRLATEAQTSTMAVYTHFGGMPALVRVVVAEGFARLAAHLSGVEQTDEPIGDLRRLASAYRRNALDNRNLYAVMFGGASLGGHRLTQEELQVGAYTFDILVEGTRRALGTGLFRDVDAQDLAGQLWSALHGYVTLELAGFHSEQDGSGERVLWPMLTSLLAALLVDGSDASKS